MRDALKSPNVLIACASALLVSAVASLADVKLPDDGNLCEAASGGFKFESVRPPGRDDAARHARFILVYGGSYSTGGGCETLHDSKGPRELDEASECFSLHADAD